VATIDSHGATALHLAVCSRRLEVVDLLLQHPHSDVNCVDNVEIPRFGGRRYCHMTR
jgi:ankyrin repeat protein